MYIKIILILALSGTLFSQSYNNILNFFNDSKIAFGLNYNLYGSYWNDFTNEIDVDNDFFDEINVESETYLSPNFSLIKHYDDIVYGIKYITNGSKYKSEAEILDSINIKTEAEFQMSLLKLFFSNNISHGFHFGLEGGYFLFANSKSQVSVGSEVSKIEEDIDSKDWTGLLENNSFEVGGLIQYFYDFTDKLGLGLEGYYSFISAVNNVNKEPEVSGIPTKFHYLNLNVIYKF